MFAGKISDIQIDKDVAFPTSRKGGKKAVSTEWDILFEKMEVGDSFLANTWLTAAAKKNAERRGVKLETEAVPNTLGYRVWLRKKPVN